MNAPRLEEELGISRVDLIKFIMHYLALAKTQAIKQFSKGDFVLKGIDLDTFKKGIP
jgi:hypothetical protein